MNGIETEISGGTCGERGRGVTINGEPNEDGVSDQVLIAKKQWQIPYWDLASELEINIDDARNKHKPYDGRSGMEHNHNHLDDVCVDKVAAGIITV